jgi:hypothetical protein
MFRRKSHSPEPETTADVEGAERTLDPEARLDERLVENAQKGGHPS